MNSLPRIIRNGMTRMIRKWQAGALALVILGHANISTTGVYLDVEPGESSGNFLPPV